MWHQKDHSSYFGKGLLSSMFLLLLLGVSSCFALQVVEDNSSEQQRLLTGETQAPTIAPTASPTMAPSSARRLDDDLKEDHAPHKMMKLRGGRQLWNEDAEEEGGRLLTITSAPTASPTSSPTMAPSSARRLDDDHKEDHAPHKMKLRGGRQLWNEDAEEEEGGRLLN
jgi:hypothetical protein